MGENTLTKTNYNLNEAKSKEMWVFRKAIAVTGILERSRQFRPNLIVFQLLMSLIYPYLIQKMISF